MRSLKLKFFGQKWVPVGKIQFLTNLILWSKFQKHMENIKKRPFLEKWMFGLYFLHDFDRENDFLKLSLPVVLINLGQKI